ncbi:MAG: endopeptidase La [Oscillospiraceae bacterium]|nr:endopeptidase La [Oscillospiraceae bacterium]
MSLPMVPMRGFSVFPGMRVIFDVDKPSALAAVDAAMEADQMVFLVSQRDPAQQEPDGMDSFYQIGTICRVRQVLRVPGEEDGKALAEGVSRGYLVQLTAKTPYFRAEVETMENVESPRSAVKGEALMRQCYGLVEKYGETCGLDMADILRVISESDDPGYIADYVTQNIYMRSDQKQLVLEELRPVRRIALVNRMLRWELDVLDAELELNDEAAHRIRKGQRDMFLREQLRSIQAELGEEEFGGGDDIEEYRLAVAKGDLPEAVANKLNKEISRLAKQPYGSAESAVIRSYLDTCLEMPWTTETEENLDAKAVRQALDADHFGLEKIKDRIVEYLSVRALSPEAKGSILCLLGPPGTGKTSIALSIARAMNRKLCRISLGGVHDEAEIRGHRKTYVGAMPGRIMAGIQQAGSKNPVMVLDEIDKLGSDYRGDPSAALLEALDPEQNSQFRDHFLELPFDLSHVFFITTANSADTIPPALLDRMEVLELSSYTDEEKLAIAKRHLLPKQRKKHGLNGNQIRISDGAIRELIALYTRESGVRRLEQQIAALCRKTAAGIVAGEFKSRYIRAGGLEELLGPAKYKDTKSTATAEVGLVHGLAWTSVGGEMLDAEVGVMPGTGKLELTGNLGDVMKESARAAMTYIRSHAEELGLEPGFYEKKDIHIHFPEGAVPKDGPSAGVTICTGLVSALMGIPVRQDVAMTGEITLRGRVLPIGGLREKTMAALRAGIHTVIIPADNEPDLAEIDQTVRAALNFITASRVEAVLDAALCREADNAV